LIFWQAIEGRDVVNQDAGE